MSQYSLVKRITNIIFITFMIMIIIISYMLIRCIHGKNLNTYYDDLEATVHQYELLLSEYIDKILALEESDLLTQEEKISEINSMLQPIYEFFSGEAHLCVGYYSKGLDAIASISENENKLLGSNVEPNHPSIMLYQSKASQRGVNAVKRGEVVRYAKLVFYKGEPIGHIWANVPFSTFYSNFSYYIRVIFVLAVGLILFALFMSSYVGKLVSKATNILVQELNGFAENPSEYSELKPSKDCPVEFNSLLNHFNEMAKKISELFQELIIASRLTNLGAAISVVSHDIRNPLTCIKLSAELGKTSNNPEKQKYYFRKILVASESINSIINKYLVLTKNPSDQFENIHIDTILIDLIAIIKKQIIQKGINFHYRIEENLPILWGNRVALSQALMNIIANAKDATPSGGEISIEAKSNKNGVLLVVTDTGVGIPKHLKRNVFKKFFTTKGNLGTGIGLALAESIITNHGGRIWLKSSVGKGTSFYVWLPTKNGRAKTHR